MRALLAAGPLAICAVMSMLLRRPSFPPARWFAIDEFVDDAAPADIVDGDDVRVIQRRDGARFQFIGNQHSRHAVEDCGPRGVE